MLKVAIVGCGKIAEGHIEEIKKLPDTSLTAVCDLEPIMAEQIAVRYGIARPYSDFKRLLEEEHPDVVHITTPPQSHYPLAKQALAAGCHLYMEKPLTRTFDESRQLIDAVVAAGKKMTINYWPNFDPPGIDLRALMDSGEIGAVVHIESYLGYNLAGAFGQALLSDAEHWIHKLPGKLFQNNLDHVVNKVVPYLPEGEIEVKAVAYRRREGLNGDATDELLDELRALLQVGGVSAYVTFSSHARPAAHFVRIYGTRKTVTADFNLRTIVTDPEQTVPSALGRLMPPFAQSRAILKQAVHNVREFAHYRAHYFAGMNRLIAEFYESIRNNKTVPIPYAHILRTAAIMDNLVSQAYPATMARGAGCGS
jgi:predicted dehydrogenase